MGKKKKRRHISRGRACFKCGKVGHRVAQCPEVESGGEVCFQCGKTGHKKFECPELATSTQGATTSPTDAQGASNPKKRPCLLFMGVDEADEKAEVADGTSSETAASPAAAAEISSRPLPAKVSDLQMPASRRKLIDEVMGGFLIGNTFARSLVTPSEAQAIADQSTRVHDDVTFKFLWIGVGDIRNPLTTLSSIPTKCRADLHFNDTSSMVLARDIVVLMLAVQYPQGTSIAMVCCFVWGNYSHFAPNCRPQPCDRSVERCSTV